MKHDTKSTVLPPGVLSLLLPEPARGHHCIAYSSGEVISHIHGHMNDTMTFVRCILSAAERYRQPFRVLCTVYSGSHWPITSVDELKMLGFAARSSDVSRVLLHSGDGFLAFSPRQVMELAHVIDSKSFVWRGSVLENRHRSYANRCVLADRLSRVRQEALQSSVPSRDVEQAFSRELEAFRGKPH